GRKLNDVLEVGVPLLVYSVVMPVLHGFLGVLLGTLAGLSVGGAMILGTLSASASYITAPAVVTSNIKEANASLALTAALVITFPFNLTAGLPLYFQLAQWMAGIGGG
ncbi:MAG: sodium-dependent bicarbonate transport family permease, partial [Chloroflexota bacterium]